MVRTLVILQVTLDVVKSSVGFFRSLGHPSRTPSALMMLGTSKKTAYPQRSLRSRRQHCASLLRVSMRPRHTLMLWSTGAQGTRHKIVNPTAHETTS